MNRNGVVPVYGPAWMVTYRTWSFLTNSTNDNVEWFTDEMKAAQRVAWLHLNNKPGRVTYTDVRCEYAPGVASA